MLPQHFNEVEGVKAQEQNELVLTFPVIACGLAEDTRNKQLPLHRAGESLFAQSKARTELKWKQTTAPGKTRYLTQAADKNPTLIAPIPMSHDTQHTSISPKISRATRLAYDDLPANTVRKTNPLGRTSLCVLRPLTSAPVPILLAHAGQQQLHLIV